MGERQILLSMTQEDIDDIVREHFARQGLRFTGWGGKHVDFAAQLWVKSAVNLRGDDDIEED